MADTSKIFLSDKEQPDAWLNLASLVKKEFPLPINGHTGEQMTVDSLSSRYSRECAQIEMLDGQYGTDLYISIPGEVQDEYMKYRSTPLFRAKGLEKHLGYNGRIFLSPVLIRECKSATEQRATGKSCADFVFFPARWIKDQQKPVLSCEIAQQPDKTKGQGRRETHRHQGVYRCCKL